MQINVAKAFNPGADDPEGWKKAGIFLGVSALCTLTFFAIIPALVLPLYLLGYMLTFMRNVASGDDEGKLPSPLSPECLWHGFIWMLVGLVYSLPLLGISMFALGGAVAAIGGAAKSSAIMSMGGLASLGIMGLAALAVIFIICCFVPMIMLQYCKRNQFGDCFQMGAILSGIARSPIDYAVVVLVPIGLNFAIGLIPPLAALVGPALGALVTASLAGQYGAKFLEMHSGKPREDGTGFNRFE